MNECDKQSRKEERL